MTVAAIAPVCERRKDVVCLAGDGSLQMNIRNCRPPPYRPPIKLFVLNNDGYISIRKLRTPFEGAMVV
jgi:acetolactate synthase-1/2/3 large subunit